MLNSIYFLQVFKQFWRASLVTNDYRNDVTKKSIMTVNRSAVQ